MENYHSDLSRDPKEKWDDEHGKIPFLSFSRPDKAHRIDSRIALVEKAFRVVFLGWKTHAVRLQPLRGDLILNIRAIDQQEQQKSEPSDLNSLRPWSDF
jgi:hypothetical protein